MAPANDTESQFKFLISCIKHSQGGKVWSLTSALPCLIILRFMLKQVNFGNVANECDIVSKGAA